MAYFMIYCSMGRKVCWRDKEVAIVMQESDKWTEEESPDASWKFSSKWDNGCKANKLWTWALRTRA